MVIIQLKQSSRGSNNRNESEGMVKSYLKKLEILIHEIIALVAQLQFPWHYFMYILYLITSI